MNILRLVHEYPLPWHGLTPGPYELSVAQAELGHVVTVVCGGYPHFRTYRDPRLRVLRTKGTLPYIGPFPLTMPLSSLRAFWYQRRHPIDVLHAHNHMGFYDHLARRVQRKASKPPFVLHLHVTAAGREAQTIAAGKHIDAVTRYYEWPLHKLSDRIGCEIADAVICCSESIRDEVLRYYGASPGKLHVVPNGVNTTRFRPDGPDMREQYRLGAHDRVILYVGGLHPRKNVLPLVQALGFLPPVWKLLVVGTGPASYVEVLRAAARALLVGSQLTGGQERLILTGYVPYPDLPRYYRTADAFVLPSIYEGFPKVVLEALASGKPVLTSPSFAGDGNIERHLFRLPDYSPQGIAEAISATTEAHRPVDVTEIQKRYDWTVIAKQIEQIYKGVGLHGA